MSLNTYALSSPSRGAERQLSGRVVGELHRVALEPGLADDRMVHLEEHATRRELRVALVEVLGVLDGAGGHAVGLQQLGHLVPVAVPGPLLQVLVEHVLVGEAIVLGGEAGIVGPRRTAEGLDQTGPLPVVEHGDGDPPSSPCAG